MVSVKLVGTSKTYAIRVDTNVLVIWLQQLHNKRVLGDLVIAFVRGVTIFSGNDGIKQASKLETTRTKLQKETLRLVLLRQNYSAHSMNLSKRTDDYATKHLIRNVKWWKRKRQEIGEHLIVKRYVPNLRSLARNNT